MINDALPRIPPTVTLPPPWIDEIEAYRDMRSTAVGFACALLAAGRGVSHGELTPELMQDLTGEAIRYFEDSARRVAAGETPAANALERLAAMYAAATRAAAACLEDFQARSGRDSAAPLN